jgi:hypothetical protein
VIEAGVVDAGTVLLDLGDDLAPKHTTLTQIIYLRGKQNFCKRTRNF